MLEALADDLRPVIEVGATRYAIHGDGIWRQAGTAPFDIRRNVPNGAIGFGVGRFEFGYAYLGRIESDALAAVNDAFYEDGKCLRFCERQYLGRYQGDGYVHGAFLRYTFGDRWLIEPGLFVYKPHWSVTVTGWWDGVDPSQRRDFTVHADNKIGVTPTLGVGYRYGDLKALLRVYGMIDNGGAYNSLYQGQTVTFTLGYRF